MKKRLLPILISLGFLVSLMFIFVLPPRESRADIYNSPGQVNWNSVFASSITAIINTYTGYYQATTTAVTSEKHSRVSNDNTMAASATGATFHEATLRAAADAVLAASDVTYNASLTGAIFHEKTLRTAADTTAATSMTDTVSHARGVLETADSTNAALVNSTANVTHNKLTITKGVTLGFLNQITGTVTNISVGGAFTFKYPGAVTTNAGYGEIRINNNSYIFPIWLKP
jgi:hypothetical protein